MTLIGIKGHYASCIRAGLALLIRVESVTKPSWFRHHHLIGWNAPDVGPEIPEAGVDMRRLSEGNRNLFYILFIFSYIANSDVLVHSQ